MIKETLWQKLMILTKTFLKQNLIVPQIKERNKHTYLRTKIPKSKSHLDKN